MSPSATETTTAPLAIVGPGAIGDVHAKALARSGVRPIAVVGPVADELAQFASVHGIERTYARLDDLLADSDVEGVVVATPSHLHSAQSVQVLESGRHVLCEIPLGLSLTDAEAVARAAERSGKHAAVGYTLRYWEPHRRLAERLRETETEPSLVVVRSMMLRQTDVGWTGKIRDWTDSVLWHHGGHAVDAALWHLRAVDGVQVLGRCGRPWPHNGTPMDVAAVLRAAGDRLATVSLSYHSREPTSDFLVVSPERTLSLSGATLREDGEVVYSADVATVQFEAVVAQDRDFLEAVRSGTAPEVRAADVLPAARVLADLALGQP
jgi:2-hydroxy-4-carboxymuconate semialdehyde hemiacetal dehydrogenase